LVALYWETVAPARFTARARNDENRQSPKGARVILWERLLPRYRLLKQFYEERSA